jgi:hypothetical protein
MLRQQQQQQVAAAKVVCAAVDITCFAIGHLSSGTALNLRKGVLEGSPGPCEAAVAAAAVRLRSRGSSQLGRLNPRRGLGEPPPSISPMLRPSSTSLQACEKSWGRSEHTVLDLDT